MTDQPASTAPLAAGLPLVQGRCPACGWASLFLGDGGHTTCSRLDCPNPCAVDDLLHGSDNLNAPWLPQDDGSWNLDIGEGRGVITVPRATTMRERAQFAAAWAAMGNRPMPAGTQAAKEQPMPTTPCTATIEGVNVPDDETLTCTVEDVDRHPANHVGPKRAYGQVLWTDHHAGATPHS